mmetsp:Transcript_1276/g.2681  ORF Transcript_1276/g.2681 Transcript_1276/m.2681 type:complete len:222 (-) Transcript_1276:996-1661(-)
MGNTLADTPSHGLSKNTMGHMSNHIDLELHHKKHNLSTLFTTYPTSIEPVIPPGSVKSPPPSKSIWGKKRLHSSPVHATPPSTPALARKIFVTSSMQASSRSRDPFNRPMLDSISTGVEVLFWPCYCIHRFCEIIHRTCSDTSHGNPPILRQINVKLVAKSNDLCRCQAGETKHPNLICDVSPALWIPSRFQPLTKLFTHGTNPVCHPLHVRLPLTRQLVR